MLRSFHIENFKSLTDFTMSDMGQFVCLIGMNGAGKTAVLQAIDFVAHLATGTVESWLRERIWSSSDLTHRLANTSLIKFQLEFGEDNLVRWQGVYDVQSSQCLEEELFSITDQQPIFQLKDGELKLWRERNEKPDVELFNFALKGSILSVFSPMFGEHSEAMRSLAFLRSVKSLEMLNPQLMKQLSSPASDVGIGGETLSGFLHNLSSAQNQSVNEDVRKFYPRVLQVQSHPNHGNLVELVATEEFASSSKRTSVPTGARHLNDGLLRVLAIIAETKTSYKLLLFDEIENGINPEKVGQLVNYLLDAKQQIMVTTHNPLILNYLPDEKAKESVFFLYRNRYGATKATRFFEIPEVAQKLEVLGPGEAFLDTSLEDLVECIENREVAA